MALQNIPHGRIEVACNMAKITCRLCTPTWYKIEFSFPLFLQSRLFVRTLVYYFIQYNVQESITQCATLIEGTLCRVKLT
jgi:hypothetical protein